ncbi:MAG: hypothetical protein ABSG84_08770 [Acidobacteriaceae bacterium]|jgi:hypothetical protein
MCRLGRKSLLGVLIGLPVWSWAVSVPAQNFGNLIVNRKKIVLQRKLPPTGHIEGTTFSVVVTTAAGLQQDLPADLKSTLESLLIRDDSRLRTEDAHPDTVISCRITSYGQPQPQYTSQAVLAPGAKGGMQNQPMERVTGVLTVSFQAKDRSGHSLAADNVTAKFDEEYSASGAQQGVLHSMSHTVTHLTKGGTDDDTPPTPVELHDRLIQQAALQIASHLVNTTEQVDVYLAKGSGLDQADKLMDEKLWSRALEQLETMKPFPTPEEDAYRLYDLGVVNEAMGYAAEDVQKARKDLQEASIDYGKAIDAKPTEKYFLQPQNRIDTALAHYKIIGDQKAPVESATTTRTSSAASSATKTASGASADTLTNEQVISMVSAGLDETNVIDTIKHAKAVNFDLSVQGQVDLSRNKVTGPVITAMKARARASAPATHHVAAAPGKSAS